MREGDCAEWLVLTSWSCACASVLLCVLGAAAHALCVLGLDCSTQRCDSCTENFKCRYNTLQDDQEEFEIDLNDDEPEFLKGHSSRSGIEMSPIKIVKNPEGSMQRAAMTAVSHLAVCCRCRSMQSTCRSMCLVCYLCILSCC